MSAFRGRRSDYRASADWLSDPLLKDWIAIVAGNDTKVFCRLCSLLLPANYTVLLRHAAQQQHKQAESCLRGPITAQILMSSMLVENREQDDNFQDAHQSNTKGVKYQQRWHMNPLFNGWLTRVEDDVTKAVCSVCNVVLRAHYRDIERHSNTAKHLKNKAASNSISNDTVEFCESTNPASPLLEDPSDSMVEEASQSVGLMSESLFIDKPCSSKPHNVSTDTLEGGGLALECESILDSSVGIAAGRVDSGLSGCSERWKPNVESGASTQSSMWKRGSEIQAPLLDVKRKKIVAIERPRHVWKPMEHGVLQAMNGGQRTNQNSESSLSHQLIQTEYLSAELNAESDEGQNSHRPINGKESNEPSRGKDSNQLIRIVEEATEASGVKNEVKRRGRRRSLTHSAPKSWSDYKKLYRREWESDPQLAGWVAPVHGNRCKAACKYCGSILRAHYADLRHHANTTKHKKHEHWQLSGFEPEPEVVFNAGGASVHSASEDVADSTGSVTAKQQRISSCYVFNKQSNWSKYKKRYRPDWEKDPNFQGWLASVPGDDTRARCRYCRMLLRAHYNDLRAHSRTTKHANNVAFALPCDETGVSVALSPPPRGGGAAGVGGGGRVRRRGVEWWARARNKTGTSSTLVDPALTSGVISTDIDLCAPDETLGSVESLASLAYFSWGPPPPTETTLIFPRNLPLDAELAASLPCPQTPGSKFRVRKEVFDEVMQSRMGKLATDSMKDSMPDALLHQLTRSITLWEFLDMKTSRSSGGSGGSGGAGGSGGMGRPRPRVEAILCEFEALRAKVKAVSQELLKAVEENEAAENMLVLNSAELAQCIGLPVGKYSFQSEPPPSVPSTSDLRRTVRPKPRRRDNGVLREGSSKLDRLTEGQLVGQQMTASRVDVSMFVQQQQQHQQQQEMYEVNEGVVDEEVGLGDEQLLLEQGGHDQPLSDADLNSQPQGIMIVDYSDGGGLAGQAFVGKEEPTDLGGAEMRLEGFVGGVSAEESGQISTEGYDFVRDSNEDANNVLYISYDGVIDEETLSNLVSQLSNQEFSSLNR